MAIRGVSSHSARTGFSAPGTLRRAKILAKGQLRHRLFHSPSQFKPIYLYRRTSAAAIAWTLSFTSPGSPLYHLCTSDLRRVASHEGCTPNTSVFILYGGCELHRPHELLLSAVCTMLGHRFIHVLAPTARIVDG